MRVTPRSCPPTLHLTDLSNASLIPICHVSQNSDAIEPLMTSRGNQKGGQGGAPFWESRSVLATTSVCLPIGLHPPDTACQGFSNRQQRHLQTPLKIPLSPRCPSRASLARAEGQ